MDWRVVGLLLALALCVATQAPPDDETEEDSSRAAEIDEAWKAFVEKYNKKFATNTEERLR